MNKANDVFPNDVDLLLSCFSCEISVRTIYQTNRLPEESGIVLSSDNLSANCEEYSNRSNPIFNFLRVHVLLRSI